MTSKTFISIFCLMLACAGPAYADAITDKVDAVFAEWDAPDSPGCAVAISSNGKVVYKRGYGLANIEYGVPNAPDTIFHVASVSKQFTAFAIAILADSDKLSLDDDVHGFVPELPDYGHTITIRHLLNHTSGLRDQWELLMLAGWRMEDVITLDDAMNLILAQRELNFRPGDRHLYSNSGYTLLAVVVERVSGQPFAKFCDEMIFSPAGMDHTHFHDSHRHIVKNRAYSYVPDNDGTMENRVLSFAIAGATSLFTTAEDLIRWQENYHSSKVGNAGVVETMLTRGVLNSGEKIDYASGLEHGVYRGLEAVRHGGVDAGFRAHTLRFPKEHFSVVILGNVSSLQPAGLAEKIADIYLGGRMTAEETGEPGEAPATAPPSGDGQDLKQYEGMFANPRTAELRRIRVKDGRLQLSGEGPGATPLTLESGGRFEAANGDDPFAVEFVMEKRGGPSVIQIHRKGVEVETLERVEPRDASAKYLAEIEGEYRCEELDTVYTVAIVDGKPVLRRRKYGDSPLGARYRDGYATTSIDFGAVSIHFTRDKRGQVDGFRISTGRAKGIRFTKLDNRPN